MCVWRFSDKGQTIKMVYPWRIESRFEIAVHRGRRNVFSVITEFSTIFVTDGGNPHFLKARSSFHFWCARWIYVFFVSHPYLPSVSPFALLVVSSRHCCVSWTALLYHSSVTGQLPSRGEFTSCFGLDIFISSVETCRTHCRVSAREASDRSDVYSTGGRADFRWFLSLHIKNSEFRHVSIVCPKK